MKKFTLIKVALSPDLLASAANKAYGKFKATGNINKGKQYLKFMNGGGVDAALRPRKKGITVKVS